MYRRLAALAALAFALPFTATAAPVTLNFTGSINTISDPLADLPPDLSVGLPFELSLTYDSAAPFLFGGAAPAPGTGSFGFYSGVSLTTSIVFGTSCPAAANCGADPTLALSRIAVFNDFTAAIAPANTAPVDALVFALLGADGTLWTIGFGTNDLTALSDTTLPGAPSDAFTLANLRVCTPVLPANLPAVNAAVLNANCNAGNSVVTGTLARVQANVPEASTLALLGLGLLGIGVGVAGRRPGSGKKRD